ncbi:TetR/AcrR family transcriptional regulator C-terminal domain-containing protein [Saccharopolyspora sp. ASAGF58]|uniref:TetR/AcrR family transcriptional regulator C-terminal domain-containing protein n=1 Tax=Saccharopolyspora sp. ASAGF58 TaxID=2719023 RepID=UPI001B30656B|nr:TetR/AcrR family transcriptional regulator C-terminal domain-containing protein [Saccharopolyspora sp. ASAGF58]
MAEVASVRSVPEFQRSGLRRLVFVRFRGAPVLEKLLAAGPQSVHERLALYLRKIAGRGLLAIDDAKQAALHFNLLTVTTMLQRTFYGSMPMPPGRGRRDHRQRRAGVLAAVRAPILDPRQARPLSNPDTATSISPVKAARADRCASAASVPGQRWVSTSGQEDVGFASQLDDVRAGAGIPGVADDLAVRCQPHARVGHEVR